jgi:hypothetical protein
MKSRLPAMLARCFEWPSSRDSEYRHHANTISVLRIFLLAWLGVVRESAGAICSSSAHARQDPIARKLPARNRSPSISNYYFDIAVTIVQNPSGLETKLSVALLEPPKSYVHSRIAFLRASADLERRRNHHSGVTPPYCPVGPPLLRNYILDDWANFAVQLELSAVARPHERSLLSSSRSLLSLSPDSASIRYDRRVPATKMPHALSMPQTGFQALILCGPGGSLNTFTTVPKEHPKALITLANRPMVWYVLDWCYRMGVTSRPTFVPFHPAFLF